MNIKNDFNFSENHRIMNAFGRRTKFTWRSSGVTYLARDPNAMGPKQFTWRPWGVTLYATHYVHNSMNLWKMKFISYVNVSCPCEVVSKRRRE